MNLFKIFLCGFPTVVSFFAAVILFSGTFVGILVIFVGGICSLSITAVTNSSYEKDIEAMK